MIQQTNSNIKHRISANTSGFLITLVHLTPDSFGCTNTHIYVHTYTLFGLQVHSAERDKARANGHTPVRMVPGLICTSPRCGYPCHIPVLLHCLVFKSMGCMDIPTQTFIFLLKPFSESYRATEMQTYTH